MARVAAFVLLCSLTTAAPASSAPADIMVRELVAAVRSAAAAVDLKTKHVQAFDAMEGAARTLESAGVLDDSIADVFERFLRPDALAIARRRQTAYSAEIKPALDTLKLVANTVLPAFNGVTPEVRRTVGELQTREQQAGLAWDLETLRMMERKYGPNSAKLNGMEVLVAYALQRTPGFGVDSHGRPGRFEAVLAYAPSYLTRSDEKMRVVGVAEVGLRQYIFAKNWGASTGRWAWLRPGYASYGVAWAAGSDDPLTPPWKGRSRYGAFLGWGQFKVAWLAGENRRVLVTQQFQLVPWLF